MKITHILGSGRTGGIETHVLTLSLVQVEAGHEVSIVVFSEKGPLSDLMQEKGLSVYFVNAKNGHDFFGALRARRLCKQLNPDIIHSHDMKFLSPVSLGGLSVSRVNTVHCIGKNKKTVLLEKYLSCMNRWLVKFIDGFIAVSQDVHDRFTDGGNFTTCPWRVIFNGIDHSKFHQDNDITLPTEKNQPIELLMVSRMESDKHPDDVIRTVALLRNKYDLNVRLTLCGDGSMLPQCRELVKELEISEFVTIAGQRNDVNQFMRKSHGMFILSDYETFAQVPLEGTASGCPVFAYHVPGGLHEWFKDEGCGGVISEERTPESLAEKIVPILSDKNRWEQIRKDAIETAKGFSDTVMAEKTVAFYQELRNRSQKNRNGQEPRRSRN